MELKVNDSYNTLMPLTETTAKAHAAGVYSVSTAPDRGDETA